MPESEMQDNLVAADNLAEQSEELVALQAIYGPESFTLHNIEHTLERRAEMRLPSAEAATLQLRICLPATYPAQAAPLAEISAPHLPESVLRWAVEQLENQFHPGEPVLYNWIEWLKEQDFFWPQQIPAAQQSLKQAKEQPPSTSALAGKDPDTESVDAPWKDRQGQQSSLRQAQIEAADRHRIQNHIIHGEPFTERRSTFQAHLAAVNSVEEVQQVMSVLLENGKIGRATHNILAYRIWAADKDTYLQDCDDDGESAAGGRLLHLLQILDARNVAVVVSRWYGGVLLGPARFTHINNAARNLLEASGYILKDAAAAKKKRSKS